MTDGFVAVDSIADALDHLRSPFALEEVATSAVPAMVVGVAGDTVLGDDDASDLYDLLAAVRAITVAVVDGPVSRTTGEFLDRFDIVLTTDETSMSAVVTTDPGEAIDAVARAIRAHPLASVAMAQLLRQRAYLDVGAGLVAESLTYSMLQSGPEFAAWLANRGPTELPADPEPPVLSTHRGTAMEIVLNRPHRANAVSAALRDGLVEALRVAAVDPTVEGVILRGQGASFCSGGDLAEFGSLPDPATAHATRLTRSPAWWVHRQARDVRVHLHGACVGAGIELPAFAGMVLASPDTRVRLPEVAMGLVPGAGGTVSLPRRMGPHRTCWLALTGQELDAHEALAWGLVDRIESP